MITYFLTKVKGFFEINIINKGKYLDFLYVFVVFGDLYNGMWDFLRYFPRIIVGDDLPGGP